MRFKVMERPSSDPPNPGGPSRNADERVPKKSGKGKDDNNFFQKTLSVVKGFGTKKPKHGPRPLNPSEREF